MFREYSPKSLPPTFSLSFPTHCWVALTLGYRGEKPFQAVESKLLSKYIHNTLTLRNVAPVGYVDFHSYSQLILYPFAYDCDVLPRDAEDLAEAAWGAAKAARNVHGRYYDVNSACEGNGIDLKRKKYDPREKVPLPFHPANLCRERADDDSRMQG